LGYSNGYVTYTDTSGKSKRLHRMICEGDVIDHISGDTLDNRKINLRATTMYVNQYN